MKNMIYDDDGILNKWPGFKKAFLNSLGSGSINGLFPYKDKIILAWGTKLFTFKDDGNQPVQIYEGMSGNRIRKNGSFIMNDKFYILDGKHYLQYDGTNIVDVCTIAHIPTVVMGAGKDGGGSPFEDFNLLNGTFYYSISPDGTSTTYNMMEGNVDTTPITISIDKGLTFNKIEGIDFTVIRQADKTIIDFSKGATPMGAPAVGTDSLKVKACITVAGMKDKILNCTITGGFGGANDSHVFFTGNPDYKNTDWRSGVLDPTYIPENSWTNIGSNSEAITGYSIQYNTQVIQKESGKFVRSFELNNGDPVYSVQPINDERGLIAPDTLELIDNNPFGLDKKGINALEGGTVRDERGTKHKSSAVDVDLLKEDLTSGIAVDYNFKYWLVFPSGNAYVCDYKHVYADKNNLPQYEWFELDNIPAACFCEANGYLYFGDNTTGMVYRFLKYSDVDRYQLDGKPIVAMWPSKRTNFGTDEYYKYINTQTVTIKPETRASADVYYITDQFYSPLVETIVKNIFSYSNMDYGSFSYNLSDFPQTETIEIREGDVSYYQTVIKNDQLYCGMGIQRIEIEYELQGRR